MTAMLLNGPASATSESQVVNEAWVADQVFRQLGKPKDLIRVQVRELWKGSFRVNIYRELDKTGVIPRAEVTDSFFVTASGDGIISKPAIERKY